LPVDELESKDKNRDYSLHVASGSNKRRAFKVEPDASRLFIFGSGKSLHEKSVRTTAFGIRWWKADLSDNGKGAALPRDIQAAWRIAWNEDNSCS
jgi:hypothetical protein